MKKVIITDDMKQQASERDKGAYNGTSFMDGQGNFVGFLGEYMVGDTYPILDHVDKFSHDFEFKGKTIEVKTKTQNVSRTPLGTYEASITMSSLKHQDPDYYIFCRAYKKDDDYKFGWVIGGISTKDLFKYGRLLKKGERDGDNGYVVKNDCINIRYDQLKPLGGS